MNDDETAAPRLQTLTDARPGVRENLGDWLRGRLGLPGPREQTVWRSISEPPLPREARGDVDPAPARTAAPLTASESAAPVSADEPANPPPPPPRRVTVLGAPHPITRRLFADIETLVALRVPDGRSVLFNFATTAAVAECEAEVFIYLRSDCAGGCRIVAALSVPGEGRLAQAAARLTRLDDGYWHRPNLSVESALLHGPYLLSRLGELLGLSFGPDAQLQAQALFAERARYAELYCDPLGYVAGVELDGPDGAVEAAPWPAAPSNPPAPSLLAHTLQAFPTSDILIVAPDGEAAREDLAARTWVAGAVQVCGAEEVLARAEGEAAGPRAACLYDMVEAAHTPQVVDRLQQESWVLCGLERSVEAVRRLCARCLDAGVGHHLTFVFEGAEWKAVPRVLFER